MNLDGGANTCTTVHVQRTIRRMEALVMACRIASLCLVTIAALATPAIAQPKASVRIDTVRLTPSGTVAPSATVVFKNVGKEKSEGSVFETQWCQRGDSFFKPRDGAWSVVPTLNDCVPIQANLDRHEVVVEGGATIAIVVIE